MVAPQKRIEPPDEEIVVLRGALQTLYDLLEAFAPSWYTDEARESAEYALVSGCRGCDQLRPPTQR